MLVIIVSTYYL